jgi:hypothetical protein
MGRAGERLKPRVVRDISSMQRQVNEGKHKAESKAEIIAQVAETFTLVSFRMRNPASSVTVFTLTPSRSRQGSLAITCTGNPKR